MSRIMYVLCGISGAGKSTWANTCAAVHDNYVVVSSDAIRKELYGDESVQKNPKEVFNIAYIRIKNCLELGYDVIFDATNLKARDRKNFLKWMDENVEEEVWRHTHKEIMVFECPLKNAIMHQQFRTRQVPSFVVERQYKQFERPTEEEGWDRILYM